MVPLILLAALGQQPGGDWSRLQDWESPALGSRLGSALAALDDVNADGFHDLLAGSPDGDLAYTTFGRGHVVVLDGYRGHVIRRLDGAGLNDGFGAEVLGFGDCDGDGIGDMAVGTRLWVGGTVDVYSGATGAWIHQFAAPAGDDGFGWALADAGDLDGDGRGDLWIAARGADPAGLLNAGRVTAYSGRTYAPLRMIEGKVAYQFLGKELAGGQDANGDGKADLLVQDNGAGAGAVRLYSGASGAELRRHDAVAGRNVSLGQSLAFIGDLDLDGRADYLMGDQFYQPSGAGQYGAAWAYSGATGAILWSQEGRAADGRFGCAVAGLGDINGDRTPDFAVGASHERRGWSTDHQGTVAVFSGADFMILQVLPGDDAAVTASYEFGAAVVGLGDGRGDVAVGAPSSSTVTGGDQGRVHLYGLVPWISATGPSISAANGGLWGVTLDFPASFAGRNYTLLPSPVIPGTDRDENWVSWQGARLPIIDSVIARRMFRSAPGQWVGASGMLDLQGRAQAGVAVIPGMASAWVGQAIRFAAIVMPRSPGGSPDSSAAVTLRILP